MSQRASSRRRRASTQTGNTAWVAPSSVRCTIPRAFAWGVSASEAISTTGERQQSTWAKRVRIVLMPATSLLFEVSLKHQDYHSPLTYALSSEGSSRAFANKLFNQSRQDFVNHCFANVRGERNCARSITYARSRWSCGCCWRGIRRNLTTYLTTWIGCCVNVEIKTVGSERSSL